MNCVRLLSKRPCRRFRLPCRPSFPSFSSSQQRLFSLSSAPFPSIVISRNGITPNGTFSEMQAEFLEPDTAYVMEIDKTLRQNQIGVVAHYYMDAELQGVLSALSWEHTFIADSLAMGDQAVRMAQRGVKSIVVLGVDFLAESVRANLDAAGYEKIPVYRISNEKIGCSLAEAAENVAYKAYLSKAAEKPNALHVVYINTSLRSKAYAQGIIPTITCTSSNVIQTILSAAAQVPGIHLAYGPDTYMGQNLQQLLEYYATLPNHMIQQIHPAHDQSSIRSLLQRFSIYMEGNCIVHHMFGDAITQRIKQEYSDVYCTAHLEVPGEMFTLAMKSQNTGRGVTGSTSDILRFIVAKTEEAAQKNVNGRLRFILGTETGMITSIIQAVKKVWKKYPSNRESSKTEVEIIFPVAEETVTKTKGMKETEEIKGIVPGVASGEGCSLNGGCATCPYMKMNTLEALRKLVHDISQEKPLSMHYPEKYTQQIQGKGIAAVGAIPILNMKHLMTHKQLSPELVKEIQTRKSGK